MNGVSILTKAMPENCLTLPAMRGHSEKTVADPGSQAF